MSDTILPENVASALLNAGSGLQEETGSSSAVSLHGVSKVRRRVIFSPTSDNSVTENLAASSAGFVGSLHCTAIFKSADYFQQLHRLNILNFKAADDR